MIFLPFWYCRFLYLPLFDAERAWAYAMQLKSEANTEVRKKFHLINRLKKAVYHAEHLASLCESDKCDARTKLEAQVPVKHSRDRFTWFRVLHMCFRNREKFDWCSGAVCYTRSEKCYTNSKCIAIFNIKIWYYGVLFIPISSKLEFFAMQNFESILFPVQKFVY